MDDRLSTAARAARFARLLASLLALAAAAVQAEEAPPEVVSLILIDAERNEALFELEDGITLDFGTLGTRNLSVDARTLPRQVGSVVFALNGEEIQLENIAPYAIAGDGDDGTDFYPWTPPLGDNVLTATPYSERNASGQPGVARTVRFAVVERSEAQEPVLRASPARTPQLRRVPGATPSASDDAREAYAILRPTQVVLEAGGTPRGAVLFTDYGQAGTTLAVVLNDGAARGLAQLGVGGCAQEAAVLLALRTLEGGSSVTATPLRYQGLMAGGLHVRVIPDGNDAPPGDVLCGELRDARRR